MDVVTATEHRAITISNPFYNQTGPTARGVPGKQHESSATTLTVTNSAPMDVVEPSVKGASEALVAYTSHQTPVTTLMRAEPNSSFAGGSYLPADEVDDQRHQHDHAIALLMQYQGRGPPPYKDSAASRPHSSPVAVRPVTRLPTRTDPPSAAESGHTQLMVTPRVTCARKRTRDLASVTVSSSVAKDEEATPIQGAEESKGETPIPHPIPSTPYRHLSAQEALRKYAVLADGARSDGPDYIPSTWDPQMSILEIPWSQLPLICALGRPLGFIPTSHVLKVRRAFIHCLQELADSPYDEKLWKRVALLPTVLFIDIGKCRRADLDTKVDLILANTWPFLVGDFPGRLEKTESATPPTGGPGPGPHPGISPARGVQVIGSVRDPDKRRLEYFKKLMGQGEVSKAFRAITSEAKGASPGVDNFPVDILKQLTKTQSKKEFPVDTRLFLDLLTWFFNRMFTFGQCPRGVLNFYDSGELIRLLQGASKIRPIGKATTFRKIVDVAQNKPHRAAQQEEFADLQYCGAAFGTERMLNAMSIHLQVNPDQTYSSSDYKDAYCHVDRSKILDAVMKVMPTALDPIHKRLTGVQDVIYFGNELGPDTIKQAVGLTQGQATSGQLYSLGIHPLNKEIAALANQHAGAAVSAYIDDVKTHTSAVLVDQIISHQLHRGPAYGAFLKMDKHRILLEACPTDLVAENLQAHFHTKFGIPLERILLHPSNIADPAARSAARGNYGDVILGIPASPFPEFIDAFVQGEITRISTEWRLASSRLKDEPHHLWYLLRHILGSKFTYLFRGIAPEFSQPLADCLTGLHRETCEILAQSETISDLSFDLARIPEGAGLG
eukprot:gene69318-biopygen18419